MKTQVPLLLPRDLGSLTQGIPLSHHQVILPWFDEALRKAIPDEEEVPLSSSNNPRVCSGFGLKDHANICIVLSNSISRISADILISCHFTFLWWK